MKHEWRKHEKARYLPKTKPELITVPSFNFFVLDGTGNPNDENFAEAIGVLYSLAYGVKMLPKKGVSPDGYFDYSVYPLEGIWDLSEAAKKAKRFNKNDLVYQIMIRQPDFVTPKLAAEVLAIVKNKKPHPLLNDVHFKAIEDGRSVQVMHWGRYDDEPESFNKMAEFCKENDLVRAQLTHREIYLNDARKTAPDQLKTVLRYAVKDQ
ncbi:GyrI-like domain-containing protein [Acetobacterium woodii]|uniref:GyrI-like small molecule binding domain-containing protein n=1 Tax=Acetobacterium woodii (strain ATCC 29683 / DSM 1030 / JCM 2381 / KCTC 1655 / WB1) TaxID=931626 RepID=H6LHP9_ACEWD|nr:GyrI-like domain-containing protein [Acetobacterium woodii]AFA47228.1 hypothetical protein Awo_c04270 [Acetobacterium woodii DSM 1030]